MSLQTSYQKYTLNFKFEAGTSRGVLNEKQTYFIKVSSTDSDVFGLGECGPLKGLSIDDVEGFEDDLTAVLRDLEQFNLPASQEEAFDLAAKIVPYSLPSVRFGVETALLDLLHGGNRVIFQNEFSSSEESIPINGLIWMGHMESMLGQITQKVASGYDCIKMKIGAIDFKKECDILYYIRRKYYRDAITLRVDANGAFGVDEAMEKLKTISQFNIHSIEQPIKAGNLEAMKELCEHSPVPIALDEELIGINGLEAKRALLEMVKPQYIILKPTLVGGFASCNEWISIADELNIGWWLTSALESNIGLNAICQYTYTLNTDAYQGLGTGQLYHNNIESPLEIYNGAIKYSHSKKWDLKPLSI